MLVYKWFSVIVALWPLGITATSSSVISGICSFNGKSSVRVCHEQWVERAGEVLGWYSPSESSETHQIYRSKDENCWNMETKHNITFYSETSLICCNETVQPVPFVIQNVSEPVSCSLYITICSLSACHAVPDSNTLSITEKLEDSIIWSSTKQRMLKERVRQMFQHGYDSYMLYAYPQGQLAPLSCQGAMFDLIKIPLVTLVDSMDTLVLLGNYTEFKNAVQLVSKTSFNLDVNISVFETTIRILGGLLSAHLFAIDPLLAIYEDGSYHDELLQLAKDVGDRLLPAFETLTGIPYGTVNLRYGVPFQETVISSTAGSGSLFLEFGVLSHLTGDWKYGEAASKAMRALHRRSSFSGLVGKHINTKTGQWTETQSGIGSNVDSFYEYMIKAHALFQPEQGSGEMLRMFNHYFISIKRFLQAGPWFHEADMYQVSMRRNRVENLAAFWPGVEASLGYTASASSQLNAFLAIWANLGFLPEELDQDKWLKGENLSNHYYPLRPELIESIYHQYQATKDRSWLMAGELILKHIEAFTRTECGYASITKFSAEEYGELVDEMPSFFLSETLKYLYLLFDEENQLHSRPYIMSTEAHPFETRQLFQHAFQSNLPAIVAAQTAGSVISETTSKTIQSMLEALLGIQPPSGPPPKIYNHSATLPLPHVCPKPLYWDEQSSFDAEFATELLAAKKSSTGQMEVTNFYPEEVIARLIMSHPSFGVNSATAQSEAVKTVKELFQDELLVSYASARLQQQIAIMDSKKDSTELLTGTRTESIRKLIASNAAILGRSSQEPTCPVNPPKKIIETKKQPMQAPPQQQPQSSSSSSSSAAEEAEESPSIMTSHRRRSGQTPLNTLKIPINDFGDFDVEVYVDGFFAYSHSTRTALDISSVGEIVVMAREYLVASSSTGDEEIVSRMVTGNGIGNTTRCEVALLEGKSKEVLKRFDCSIATFGPTSLAAPITAELEIAPSSDRNLCNAALYATEAATGAGKDSKWSWSWKSSKGTEESPPSFDTKIAFAQRGNCLFLEKARIAEANGALALIVGNHEDNHFLMSTLSSLPTFMLMEDMEKLFDTTAVSIPTVMLSRSDVEELLETAENTPESVARLTLTSLPSLLDTELMGSRQYPKMIVRTGMVVVLGSAGWGLLMSIEDSKEWQLFILSNAALTEMNVTPWMVLQANHEGDGRMARVNAHTMVESSSLRMYSRYLDQTCPTEITVDNHNLIIETSE